MRIPELQIENKWHLQYSASFPPVSFGMNQQGEPIYESITEIITPIIFNQPIIAVSISTSVPVGRIWKYAGYLSRSVTIGLGASFEGDRKRLFLNKFNLIVFDHNFSDYFVSIQPPTWFINANVAIYQYQGLYQTLEDDLDRIEAKINALGVH